MGNTATVGRESVETDPRLRSILESGRRAAGNLSQRAAAGRAGISPVYWQKIESGAHPAAPAGTLASMFRATGVSAGYLRNEGYTVVAAALDDLTGAAPEIGPEEYLAATPGASAEEITALQAVWRALKAQRTAEPLESELGQHSRRKFRPAGTPVPRKPQDSRHLLITVRPPPYSAYRRTWGGHRQNAVTAW